MGDQQVLEHRVQGLPAHPASAGLARRLLLEVFGDVLSTDMLEAAQLLISEVVTNAIVHARSEIGLTVSVTDGLVRIEVSDHSPHLPRLGTYDEMASTGRGLDLVAKLATDFGVITDDDGKSVWFTLGAPAGPDSAAAVTLGLDDGASKVGAAVDVTLLGVPVTLYCAWHQHASALLRERLLIHLGHDADDLTGEADEIATVNAALALLAAGTAEVFHLCNTDSDVAAVDVHFDLPAALIPRFAVLRTVLERAVSMAASGALLTPTSQPEIVALRNWCCSELLRQASGLDPTRWQLAEDPTESKPTPEWDTTTVTTSPLAMLAADDSNRIIAVSESGAAMLGWTVDDLVGRRIVTVVPVHLREAHIAGFTRYLMTGQRRIIGKPVGVVARRHDGSELAITLALEVAPAEGSRTVFVATMSPA